MATAALVIGLAGGITAPTASADDAVAPTAGAAFDEQAVALLGVDGVESVTTDGEGNVVLAVTTPEDDLAPPAEEFVTEHSNVDVQVIDAPFSALASTDVVAGAGYVGLLDDGSGFLCSIGFTGFSPSGRPAVISAGHCTGDGLVSRTLLTVPSGDPAGGGGSVRTQAELGTFGYSQFGGPGNTAGDTDRNATDVSVIDVTNTSLTLRPWVTNWATPADLSQSARPVTAVGTAEVGGQVVKSGRTTGLTEGTVGAFGWARVDGRLVYGFETNVRSDHGDSGGAVLQGGTAVGVVSGGTTSGGAPLMWAADLPTALARTGGYTVAVSLAAPVLVGPAANATIEAGALVSGTAPANTTLAVQSSVGESFQVPVTAAGTWSFPATTTTGSVSYTLTVRSGYSASAPLVVGYTVVTPNARPIGQIDAATASGRQLTVSGWTLDPDTSDSIPVHVYVDGTFAGSVTASGSRPDVERAYGKGAAHGFSWSSTVAYGSHQVCVYAIDSAGGPNPSLGCRTVSVSNAAPIGNVDAVSASGNALRVSGWALDPDTSDSIPVHVYIDGTFGGAVTATGTRPDVERAYGKGAAHGFNWSSTVAYGSHQVCVYAIDSAGGPNPSLGCRTVSVTNAAPIGNVDAVSTSGSRLTVSGWALDPDTADSIPVHVYVDGKAVLALAANRARPDVDRAYGKGAAHGFVASATVAPGSHRVCVYAIDSAGGANPLLGCRTS
ncbi:S1 family peptidase [Cellulomonas taurus]|uniref:S1 family peptidase n=1 Tax=Cellulomonas taurus TaxID=2729175 RepID=UPI00145D3E2F|nr:S1 family peptidase [Cellulomonas taurus]